MMIGIATTTVDPYGALLLDCNDQRTNLGDIKRRVTRIATLDLGAAIIDTGYTDADRTVTLDISNETEANVEAAKWVTKYHSRVLLFLPDGAHAATPEQVTEARGNVTWRLLISGAASLVE